jgi:hypothetical protein
MNKRLDYTKLARDKKMRERGRECLEELDAAEEARKKYRAAMNERGDDPNYRGRKDAESHKRIKAQADADFAARQRELGVLIRSSARVGGAYLATG